MHSASQTKKVLDFLRKNAPQQYNAKTLSKILKIPLNSVKVSLRRLVEQRRLFLDSPGFYVAYIDISLLSQLDNPPTALHIIMLECKTMIGLQKCIDDIPSKEYSDEAFRLFSVFDFIPTSNYRYYKVLWFEGRRITITVHLQGKLDIYIKSTDNPIIYPDFLRILSYLEGIL